MNPMLELRDIHAAAQPAFWPPAPGWWLMGAVILIVLILAVVKGLQAWHRWRRRRFVLNELQALSKLDAGPELAARTSALLKRVALERFARREVARLSGEAWLAFLDRTGGDGRFAGAPGRVLADGPYVAATQFNAAALLELAADWVRRNT